VNARDGLSRGRLEGGVSRLEVHAVPDHTARPHYAPRVAEFLQWLVSRNLMHLSRVQVPLALADFLDHLCYVERRGIAAGRDAVHGFAAIYPDFSASLAEAHRALQAWARLGLQGEGAPVAIETVALVVDILRQRGEPDYADAVMACADAWMRWQDIEHLRCEDIHEVVHQGRRATSLALGVRERGEATKTGPDQGVLIDHDKVAEMLHRRRHKGKPSDKVFLINKARLAMLWALALTALGHPYFPLHTLRHVGPSRDAYEGYRGIPEIGKRGRWNSREGVKRYSKAHKYIAALALLSPEQLRKGRGLLRAWGQRPNPARQ